MREFSLLNIFNPRQVVSVDHYIIVEFTASARPKLLRKMDVSESDMLGLKRLSDLCSKHSDDALKSHASHATKLADTSERTHTTLHYPGG